MQFLIFLALVSCSFQLDISLSPNQWIEQSTDEQSVITFTAPKTSFYCIEHENLEISSLISASSIDSGTYWPFSKDQRVIFYGNPVNNKSPFKIRIAEGIQKQLTVSSNLTLAKPYSPMKIKMVGRSILLRIFVAIEPTTLFKSLWVKIFNSEFEQIHTEGLTQHGLHIFNSTSFESNITSNQLYLFLSPKITGDIYIGQCSGIGCFISSTGLTVEQISRKDISEFKFWIENFNSTFDTSEVMEQVVEDAGDFWREKVELLVKYGANITDAVYCALTDSTNRGKISMEDYASTFESLLLQTSFKPSCILRKDLWEAWMIYLHSEIDRAIAVDNLDIITPLTFYKYLQINSKVFLKAASERNVELLSKLINSGMDVNLQDADGNSALHHSIMHGCLSCVKLLIKSGSNPDIRNNDGMTAIELGLFSEDDRITNFLSSWKQMKQIKEIQDASKEQMEIITKEINFLSYTVLTMLVIIIAQFVLYDNNK